MAGVAGMGTPNSLKKPVPNQIDLENVAQVPNVSEMKIDAPAQPQAAPSQAQPSLDDIFNETMAEKPSLDQLFEETMAEEVPDMRGAGSLTDPASVINSLKQQLEQAPTRFRASFAKTDSEKKFVLDQAYGTDNVRQVNGEFEFRKPGKKNWQKFDSDNLELVGDTLDFARDAIEEATATGVTLSSLPLVAGEVAAVPATLGASAAAIVPTIAAARGLGAAAGQTAGNVVQSAMGIPFDPSRNFLKETASSAAFSVFGGAAGDFIGQKLAERAARKMGDKAAILVDDAIRQEVSDIKQVSDKLKTEGLIENIPGYETVLLPSQMATKSAKAQAAGKQVAPDQRVQDYLKVQGDMISEAFGKLFNRMSNYSKSPIEGIGEKFASKVDDLTEAEGKIIGGLRQKAIDLSKKEAAALGQEMPKMEVPKLNQQLIEIGEKVGIKRVGDNFVVPKTRDELQEIVNRGFAENIAEAKSLVTTIENYTKQVYNSGGKLDMQQIDTLRSNLQDVSNNLWKKVKPGEMPSDRTIAVTKLKDAVRDDQIDNMASVFKDPNDSALYQKAKERFSALKDSAAELKNILKNDQISSQALASSLFSKGKNSLSQIRATKNILMRDDPALWQDIVGQQVRKIVNDNSVLDTTGVSKTNWTAVSRQIDGLGDDVLKEIFPGKELDLFKNMMKFASKAETGRDILKTAVDQKNIGLWKNLVLSAQSIFAAASAGASLFENFDRNKVVLKYLNENGIEAFTDGLPKDRAGKVANLLNAYMDKMNAGLRKEGIDASGAAARQIGREQSYQEQEVQ